MEYTSPRYLVVLRGVSFMLDAVEIVILFAICALASYAIYDGVNAGREPNEIAELREQVAEDVESFEWREGMVAWLRIDGTHIDYPVMQGDDNQWYLTHDYLGRYAASGSVFLDYRNRADFGDYVSIIYGHRMNGDLMFSDVAKYADDEFFAAHQSGRLFVRGGGYELLAIEYRVLSVEDGIYSRLDGSSLGLGDDKYIILSTCDRAARAKRDILVLRARSL